MKQINATHNDGSVGRSVVNAGRMMMNLDILFGVLSYTLCRRE